MLFSKKSETIFGNPPGSMHYHVEAAHSLQNLPDQDFTCSV
jgi:hypothetical protein